MKKPFIKVVFFSLALYCPFILSDEVINTPKEYSFKNPSTKVHVDKILMDLNLNCSRPNLSDDKNSQKAYCFSHFINSLFDSPIKEEDISPMHDIPAWEKSFEDLKEVFHFLKTDLLDRDPKQRDQIYFFQKVAFKNQIVNYLLQFDQSNSELMIYLKDKELLKLLSDYEHFVQDQELKSIISLLRELMNQSICLDPNFIELNKNLLPQTSCPDQKEND